MPEKLVDPPPEEQRQAAYPRAVQKVINTSQQLQASILGNMKIPISLSGRLSNVVIWEKSHWALIQKHIPVGTFLRLRNVHIPQRWEGNNFRCESFFPDPTFLRLFWWFVLLLPHHHLFIFVLTLSHFHARQELDDRPFHQQL